MKFKTAVIRIFTVTSVWMLLLCLPVSGSIIAGDSFNDYSLGDLNAQNGGSGWTSGWSAVSGTSVVSSGGLSYASGEISIDGGSQSATITAVTNYDPLFDRGFTASADEDIWFSFLFNESVKADSGYNFFSFQLGDGGTDFYSGAIGQFGNDGGVFGARATESSASNRTTTNSSIAINTGTTYLLVGKLSKSDTNYDTISLWVNPTSITDPGAADATAVYDNIGIDTVTNFTLRTFVFSPPATPSQYVIDEVMIGTNYSSVVGAVVATPVFSSTPEDYNGSAEVTITTDTAGAEIRYTLDGSTPARDHGTIYSGPVLIEGDNVLLQAIAYLEDSELEDSLLAQANFRVGAGTYYVDPENGSMSNDGSAESPWSTLEAVFSSNLTFESGEVIYLRSGNHGSPSITGRPSGAVVIQAEEGHTPVLSGLQMTSASNWVLEGLTISPESAGTYGRGPIVETSQNSNDIIIQNCRVYSADSIDGWTAQQMISRLGIGFRIRSPNVQLLNNHIYNIHYGIEVTVTAPGMICRGNLIERIQGDGVRLLADNGLYENNIVRDFYGVDDHHDDGFQSWTGGSGGVPVGGATLRNIIIRRNLIIDRTTEDLPFPVTYGVQAIGFFDGFYEDCVFENNIIVTDMNHGITVMGAINCRIINNTVVENPMDIKPYIPRISIDNHKDGSPSTDNFVYNNITSTLLMSGLMGVKENNIIGRNYDEIFVDYENFDFRLKTGSAAIDAANPDYAPEDDYTGNLRDLLPDIGALEYHNILALFSSAVLISGDWYELDWMASGWIHTKYFPWIMHHELGWLWMGAASPDVYWMYDTILGWLHASREVNNVYYSADSLSWFYHDPDTGNFGADRWLYDFSAQEWVQ